VTRPATLRVIGGATAWHDPDAHEPRHESRHETSSFVGTLETPPGGEVARPAQIAFGMGRVVARAPRRLARSPRRGCCGRCPQWRSDDRALA
jgi:hypothetical protein